MINLIFGLVGFFFTFITTYGNNLLQTSIIRGLFGFVVWFVLAFLLRWVLGFITKSSASPEAVDDNPEEGGEALGVKLDISTPDEDDELRNLLKPKPAPEERNSEGFTPLQPPKLVSMKDPEELAKAVRHLKEE
ncbi:hypothetical protein [Paenibacillus albidus]|uniref:hypothetical protein n=1 Tax=Paenibacillus albidus TaxID=2041023 RepID=UPI001E3471AC|nr:hypothetical protein [Paenibacillus albidus]